MTLAEILAGVETWPTDDIRRLGEALVDLADRRDRFRAHTPASPDPAERSAPVPLGCQEPPPPMTVLVVALVVLWEITPPLAHVLLVSALCLCAEARCRRVFLDNTRRLWYHRYVRC